MTSPTTTAATMEVPDGLRRQLLVPRDLVDGGYLGTAAFALIPTPSHRSVTLRLLVPGASEEEPVHALLRHIQETLMGATGGWLDTADLDDDGMTMVVKTRRINHPVTTPDEIVLATAEGSLLASMPWRRVFTIGSGQLLALVPWTVSECGLGLTFRFPSRLMVNGTERGLALLNGSLSVELSQRGHRVRVDAEQTDNEELLVTAMFAEEGPQPSVRLFSYLIRQLLILMQARTSAPQHDASELVFAPAWPCSRSRVQTRG